MNKFGTYGSIFCISSERFRMLQCGIKYYRNRKNRNRFILTEHFSFDKPEAGKSNLTQDMPWNEEDRLNQMNVCAKSYHGKELHDLPLFYDFCSVKLSKKTKRFRINNSFRKTGELFSRF